MIQGSKNLSLYMDQQWSVDGQMYLDIQLEYLAIMAQFIQKLLKNLHHLFNYAIKQILL